MKEDPRPVSLVCLSWLISHISCISSFESSPFKTLFAVSSLPSKPCSYKTFVEYICLDFLDDFFS